MRKLRWAASSRGKRGGFRLIYYWEPESETFYMLYLYAKNEQRDLTSAQLKVLAKLVREEFKKAAFQELLTSIRQAGRIRRGTLKPGRVTSFRPADVKSVREKLKASQAEFALMIGVSVATLRNWEQGRRTPDGPALALLRVAARNPRAVAEAYTNTSQRCGLANLVASFIT
ncbi:MAG TPA: NadS family protein [Nitrospira sp.]|nr:NadS family protein [Nitrospira sp.]